MCALVGGINKKRWFSVRDVQFFSTCHDGSKPWQTCLLPVPFDVMSWRNEGQCPQSNGFLQSTMSMRRCLGWILTYGDGLSFEEEWKEVSADIFVFHTHWNRSFGKWVCSSFLAWKCSTNWCCLPLCALCAGRKKMDCHMTRAGPTRSIPLGFWKQRNGASAYDEKDIHIFLCH